MISSMTKIFKVILISCLAIGFLIPTAIFAVDE
jgi:hypothetical protein